MRWERFFVFVVLFAACSRETPAPPPKRAAAPQKPVVSGAKVPAPSAQQNDVSYDAALNWFRSAPAFSFVLDEGGVHAEGTMRRKTVGSETVEFRANNEEWRATAGANGVGWGKKTNGKWTRADAPPFGNRVYQRVTLAFDPQKKEGSAQLAGSEGASQHYRFTDANSGRVHDVWVAADGHLERMEIGDEVKLAIKP
jgi:hypothetical protein